MSRAIRHFMNHAPTLGKGVFVDDSAVVTGQVTLGDDTSVWPCVSIRGDLLAITIGHGSNVQDGSALHTSRPIPFNPTGHALTIGNYVTIGHNATVHGCTIGNECLIGMGSVILDGVVVENQVLVAAGSVVPPGKVLQSGYLYRGNPAQQARPLKPEEIAMIKANALDYIKLKDQHLLI